MHCSSLSVVFPADTNGFFLFGLLFFAGIVFVVVDVVARSLALAHSLSIGNVFFSVFFPASLSVAGCVC